MADTFDHAGDRTGPSRFLARLAIIRLLVFFLMLATAYVGAQIALHEVIKHVPPRYAELTAMGGSFVACLAMVVLYALLVRWMERRKVRELSPVRGVPLALVGIVIGAALFCAVYAILWAMGVAAWQGFGSTAFVVHTAIPAAIAGVGEELTIRGGVFRILEDSFGTLVALVVSAALFGLLHAANPGATPVSTAAIALEAGILLGAAYAATRNLWFPIGLHFAWNFTEGGVFGAAVSGGGAGHGLLSMPLKGPVIFTGGDFGPEASVIAVAVCLAASVVLLVVTIRRRHWVPLSFNMLLD